MESRLTLSGPVKIEIDATATHQVMMGFGATNRSAVYEGMGDLLGPRLRERAVDAVYRQVGISMGQLDGALLESPRGYEQRANDNDDPSAINWSGFQTLAARATKEQVLDLARPLGFDGAYVDQRINVRYASPWLDRLRGSNYGRYLDECAEQIAAGALFWRDTLGFSAPFLMPFNEPTTGNQELLNGNSQDVVDIVKRAGARLRREGFADIKFVVPNEETDERSLVVAATILDDREARQYVGAIGYHPYPYESAYANIPRILSTSGAGQPDEDRIAVRHRLRDLGQEYGVPLWMTEVSNGGVDVRSFDDFLGRAVHIHDELVYADAAAYFGMNNMWDLTSHNEHFAGREDFFSQEGNIVLLDNSAGTVYITGMGFAIGHYARWIKRGALRIEATSSSPLVQVTAFKDDAQGRIAVVIINNASEEASVDINALGLTLAADLTGEQSTARAYWERVPRFSPSSPTTIAIRLPAQCVTTIAGATARP